MKPGDNVSKPIMKPGDNVSKPIMIPGENVSKPIMKLKYNKYIYIYTCPFFIISRQSNPKIHYLDSQDNESL